MGQDVSEFELRFKQFRTMQKVYLDRLLVIVRFLLTLRVQALMLPMFERLVF